LHGRRELIFEGVPLERPVNGSTFARNAVAIALRELAATPKKIAIRRIITILIRVSLGRLL
jgi:hypothetical protein